jgi:hypothetical protein
MFSTYTACKCASFYGTLHDHITNYSFWWGFCPFTCCFEIFNLSLLFMFTIFNPISLSCNESSYGISYFNSFERQASESSLLQSMQIHYGAYRATRCTFSLRGGGVKSDNLSPSIAKVSTSTGMHMDRFTLMLCMSHFVHMYHFPHTLYNYIIFFWKITPVFHLYARNALDFSYCGTVSVTATLN